MTKIRIRKVYGEWFLAYFAGTNNVKVVVGKDVLSEVDETNIGETK